MARIRAILLDMDGVLVDAKEWHYQALNRALGLFGLEINRHEHLVTFDGLPTRRKLEMLSKERGLPTRLHEFINAMKQRYTMEIVHGQCKPVYRREYALAKLSADGYRLAVCSNSIRPTIDAMMGCSNLNRYIEFSISAQDVEQGKPAPDMYRAAMQRLNVKPDECLVLEDNENGIKAACASGAHLMRIASLDDVNYQSICQTIAAIEEGRTC